MALLHGTGQGVEKSNDKAVEWLKKAAGQQLPEAEYLLGVVYASGRYGVQRDEKEAIRWTRRAALQGYADAEFTLGLAYAEGLGVERDAQQALGWLRRAARRGHAPAIAYVRRIEQRLEQK
jgi:TPR repeat protein